MIIGLTHNDDGTARLRRSVTTKVAIGLPPNPEKGQNFPQRLDHMIFLSKAIAGNGKDAKMEWRRDAEKTKHYGESCRECFIVLLDDDPDVVFRTEYAWWSKTRKLCWGDGNVATRRTQAHPEGEKWTVCANRACQDLEDPKKCKPSGDLYFMLADYPTLGTICRLHTSSYQSIMEIRSALEDLRTVTGGRLLGLRVKLFVRPERNTYDSGKGMVTGTKHVLGLELSAEDLPKLASSMVETAKLFDGIKRQLSGRTIEIEESDDERAEEIAAEFNPGAELVQITGKPEVLPAEPVQQAASSDPTEDEQVAEARKIMHALNFNSAKTDAMLGQYRGKMDKLLEGLKAEQSRQPRRDIDSQPAPAKESLTPFERELGITDEDTNVVAASQPGRQDELPMAPKQTVTSPKWSF